jgi:hypothetical protein
MQAAVHGHLTVAIEECRSRSARASAMTDIQSCGAQPARPGFPPECLEA